MILLEDHNGEPFDVLNLDEVIAHIDINHIAKSLSSICRFGGQCKRFYSVAQHSILVAKILELQNAPAAVSLWGLLHDAHEAFVGDVIQPLHPMLNSQYMEARDVLDKAITKLFAVPISDDEMGLVKLADLAALKVEAERLVASRGQRWVFQSSDTFEKMVRDGRDYVPAVCNWGNEFIRQHERLFARAVAESRELELTQADRTDDRLDRIAQRVEDIACATTLGFENAREIRLQDRERVIKVEEQLRSLSAKIEASSSQISKLWKSLENGVIDLGDVGGPSRGHDSPLGLLPQLEVFGGPPPRPGSLS